MKLSPHQSNLLQMIRDNYTEQQSSFASTPAEIVEWRCRHISNWYCGIFKDTKIWRSSGRDTNHESMSCSCAFAERIASGASC